MSNDSVMLALLTDYERTAEVLQAGTTMTPEALAKYHGTTGLLLARVVKTLWTQSQLDAQIDARLQKHIDACPYQRGSATAAPRTWRDVLVDHAKLIIVCATVIIIAALVLGRVQEIGATIDRAVSNTITTRALDVSGSTSYTGATFNKKPDRAEE